MKAIFLDKDGTLVENVPFNVRPEQVTLAPRAGEALGLLTQAGYRLVVVSNQPGIALGHFEPEALSAVEQRLRELLGAEGVALHGFYYCPHHPDASVPQYAGPCECRKPAPGLLKQAAQEQRIDLNVSWMVGDILDDVEAGWGAGCRTVLLDNGNETEWDMSPGRRPDHVVSDLFQAARRIIDATDREAVRP